jgi:hypothetical protein
MVYVNVNWTANEMQIRDWAKMAPFDWIDRISLPKREANCFAHIENPLKLDEKKRKNMRMCVCVRYGYLL